MTHHLTPREKVALKPCPFCGGEVFADQEKSSFIIGCFRTKCGMEPYCTGDDLNEVANQWNRRTALASGSGEHAELVRLAEAAIADGKPDEEPWYEEWQFPNLERSEATFIAAASPATVLALLAENAALRAERDTAQSAVEAWAHVCESLEAHLQDRVAMQDVADPERYLRILRSNIARVQKDSEQIRAARWADYRRHETRATEAERKLAEAVGLLRDHDDVTRSYDIEPEPGSVSARARTFLNKETQE